MKNESKKPLPEEVPVPQRAMTPLDRAMQPAMNELEAKSGGKAEGDREAVSSSEGNESEPAAVNGKTGGDSANAGDGSPDLERPIEEREPFTCLGQDKSDYVYYSRLSDSIVRLKVSEHTRLNLVNLARKPWWDEVLGANWQVGDAACYCFDMQGKRRYSPDKLRGIGIWNEDGMPVYNAGDRCFILKDGGILETDNMRDDGTLYMRAEAKCPPAVEMLSNEEGASLVEFLSSYDWRMGISPHLLAGFVAQGILAGYLPVRAHIWVNAPAGTGKSRMINRLRYVLGGFGVHFTGGTTEAGVRQEIGNGARPVLLDEMEAVNGDKADKQRLEKIMTLIRCSTDGEKMVKGGQDAAPVTFTARSAFALFSIGNSLKREADKSRIVDLHILPNSGKEVFDKRDYAAEKLKAVKEGKLIARMMHLAPVVVVNARAIQKALSVIPTLQGRRAELLGVLLACSHALTSCGAVHPSNLKYYVEQIAASELSEESETDAERCLREIMQSKASFHGDTIGSYVVSIISDHRRGVSNGHAREVLKEVGLDIHAPSEASKLDLPHLFIRYHHMQLSNALKETDWAAGWGEVLRNFPGAVFVKQKRVNGARHKGVSIPLEELEKRGFC